MRRICVLAAWLAMVVAGGASAQGRESSDVQLRNDCRLAVQIVRTGHPAPHRDWAFGMIRQCGDSGPAALAARWRTAPPAEKEELTHLLSASGTFRTRQLFDAVASAARARSNDEVVRVYAIVLLHRYARPGTWLSIDDLLQPRRDRPARIYSSSHNANPDDPATLGDAKAEVQAILAAIIEAEPGTTVARVAAEVLRRI